MVPELPDAVDRVEEHPAKEEEGQAGLDQVRAHSRLDSLWETDGCVRVLFLEARPPAAFCALQQGFEYLQRSPSVLYYCMPSVMNFQFYFGCKFKREDVFA